MIVKKFKFRRFVYNCRVLIGEVVRERISSSKPQEERISSKGVSGLVERLLPPLTSVLRDICCCCGFYDQVRSLTTALKNPHTIVGEKSKFIIVLLHGLIPEDVL